MSQKALIKVCLALSLSVLFSFPAVAGYKFSDDGNTSNKNYSGNNYIGSDGVYSTTDPNTGLPVFYFEQDTRDNVYNGTTSIGVTDDNNTASLWDGYDQGSTYNGNLSVVGSDVNDGVVTSISNATINANTEVSAFEALPNNDLNAGVSITDSTFNGDVTVKSSTVSLPSDANVILGSSNQMDTLISSINNIFTYLSSTMHAVLNNLLAAERQISGQFYAYSEETTSDTPWNVLKDFGLGYNIRVRKFTYKYYNQNSDYTLTEQYRYYYETFFSAIPHHIDFYIRNYLYNQYLLLRRHFAEYWTMNTKYYTFTLNGEHYSLVSSTGTYNFRQMIDNRFDIIIRLLDYYCNRFYQWYYPLKSDGALYWRTYNSDTDNEESVNIARVLYDISWYLGHITIGDDISEEVQNLSDNLTNYQNAEQAIQNRINSAITDFNPPSTLITGLISIGWVSNYLQQIYLSLGAYGSIIMAGLLLGVCMQFIGYFKYKY